MNLIALAKQTAHRAHDSINHKRKYSGLPYWTHTDEVAEITARYTDDWRIIAAAEGHDTLEDVFPVNKFYSLEFHRAIFGVKVAQLVFELTDVYTREAFPHLSRKIRKNLEAERVALISPEAKLVKLADIFSNTRSIVAEDKEFARTYLREIWHKLPSLQVANEDLYQIVHKQVFSAMMQIGIDIPLNADKV